LPSLYSFLRTLIQFKQTTEPKEKPINEMAFPSEKLDLSKNVANISPAIRA
jgi:hypothetical protein